MDVPAAARALVPDVNAVIESMAVGFVALDFDWRMTHVNAAAEQILGMAAADIIGTNLWQTFPGARELEFGRVYESVMTTRQPAAFDAYYPGLDTWFELRVQPALDGIACYFLDITARKLAQSRATESAERARLNAAVLESLGFELDMRLNVERLGALVVPVLGSWSIVSFLDDDGTLTDESWWHPDPSRREDVRLFAKARLHALAGSLAEQVMRTGEPVCIPDDADAVLQRRLGDLTARAQLAVLAPRSAIVMPLRARGRTIGILSVYSDEPGTDHRYEMACDVADRAALLLDNSLAYERARRARADAEQARAAAVAAAQRVAFMAEVSEALATTPDADEVARRLARMVVPRLADWSLVTIVDEDLTVHDVGHAHRDPSRETEVAAYAARRTRMMTPSSALMVAVRTGEPFVFEVFDPARLAQAQPDPALVALARGLDGHAAAIVPLVANGRVLGALSLVTTRARGAHTDSEISMALEVAQRAAPVLQSTRAGQQSRRLAETVQRSVLAVSPSQRALQIRTRYRPAQVTTEVGGDWYDHFDLPNGCTVLTIGDVMGHDTAAIAAMAQLRTFIRATAWTQQHSPAEVLRDTDSASRALGPGTFATAITGKLDRARPDGCVDFHWSSAGHLPPAVLAPDGAVELLRASPVDVPLGVLADPLRRDHVTTLAPGSTLLLFTDGLVERRDRDIEAGLDHLREVLAGLPHGDLDAMVDKILVELDTNESHGDDVALLAVRIDDPVRRIDAPHRRRAELPVDATAPAAARRVLAEVTQGLPPGVADDAALLVSELVSNALRHGAAPLTVEAERAGAHLRVAVHDHGVHRPDLPRQLPPADEPSGRGLIILDALAESWGTDPGPAGAGKTVWFSLQIPPPRPAGASR